jgi:SAM-dependent methyltransferase
MSNLVEASYQRQQQHGRAMQLPACYTAPDSVDNWRHLRMLANLDPLISARPDAKWLTIGDGAYGADAHYLLSRGADAVASSLVTETLQIAADRGFIKNYLQVNAERIALPDDAFDFVLCKAAYHHFPRPPIALYEMLRVARLGVILIEPIEQRRVLDALRGIAKKVLRGDATTLFEPSGNYIYRTSLRELEKLMLALGECVMASRTFNDFYWPALAEDRASSMTRGLVLTKLGIAVQDLLAKAALMGWGLSSVVLFKGRPDAALGSALARSGYTLTVLATNPYAAAGV